MLFFSSAYCDKNGRKNGPIVKWRPILRKQTKCHRFSLKRYAGIAFDKRIPKLGKKIEKVDVFI
jgi:hypothetical protein